MSIAETTHLSVHVERSPKEVYDFASRPENIAVWAQGLSGGLTRDGDAWVGEGPVGRIRVRFAPPNDFGVVDHWVTEPNGSLVYIPIRVLAHGNGSELVFTLFRLPGMSDEHYAADAAAVQRDLSTLKQVLEKR